MKNKILFTLLLILAGLLSGKVTTAQNSDKKNVLKVNIITPIVRTLSTFYEHAINPKNSIQVGALFTGFSICGTKYRGFALTPEYRYYLLDNKEAPQGFYVAPFLRYQNIKLTLTDNTDNSSATYSSLGGGLTLGHQWIFSDIVALDLFLGPSYNVGKVKLNDNIATQNQYNIGSLSGFGFRVGISLGVAF